MFLTNSICLDVVMTGAIDARYETSSSGWLVQMLSYQDNGVGNMTEEHVVQRVPG